MPSFDVVSEVDLHEVANAVDQANREVRTRFDFSGTDSQFELDKNVITLRTESEFQLRQMQDVLTSKLSRRGVDLKCLLLSDPVESGNRATQTATVRQGLDGDLCRSLVKQIKSQKLKIQAAVQGDAIRVTGKKRDDLQRVMAVLREAEVDMPLQFNNFRD